MAFVASVVSAPGVVDFYFDCHLPVALDHPGFPAVFAARYPVDCLVDFPVAYYPAPVVYCFLVAVVFDPAPVVVVVLFVAVVAVVFFYLLFPGFAN